MDLCKYKMSRLNAVSTMVHPRLSFWCWKTSNNDYYLNRAYSAKSACCQAWMRMEVIMSRNGSSWLFKCTYQLTSDNGVTSDRAWFGKICVWSRNGEIRFFLEVSFKLHVSCFGFEWFERSCCFSIARILSVLFNEKIKYVHTSSYYYTIVVAATLLQFYSHLQKWWQLLQIFIE